jgi:hypothetical protein
MLLDVGNLLAALNEVAAIPARRRRSPGTAATANVSRKKDSIVTIGYVLTSLATSAVVLSNRGTLVERVLGINVWVFLLPQVFWKEHLIWRKGKRGRPNIASQCAMKARFEAGWSEFLSTRLWAILRKSQGGKARHRYRETVPLSASAVKTKIW